MMIICKKFKICFILLIILLNSCSIGQQIRGYKRLSFKSIEVASIKTIDFDSIQIFSMSPNGKYIAGYKGTLVIYDIESEKIIQEYDLKGGIDRYNIRWSSNSRYIAFTEDWIRKMYDSDIWIIDIENNVMKNLTDDNFAGGYLGEYNGILDTSPCWTKDSKSIIFARKTGKSASAMFKVPIEGGDPEKIFKITDFYMPVWTGVWNNSKTNKLYYTADLAYIKNVENGVWSSSLSISKKTHHLKVEDEKGIPYLMDFSDNSGMGIVVFLKELYRYRSGYSKDIFYIWNSKSNEMHPVKINSIKNENLMSKYRVSGAVLSPDGSMILITVETPFDWSCIIIKDLKTGKEKIIKESDMPLLGKIPDRLCGGLFWSNDNHLLVTTPVSGTSAIFMELSN